MYLGTCVSPFVEAVPLKIYCCYGDMNVIGYTIDVWWIMSIVRDISKHLSMLSRRSFPQTSRYVEKRERVGGKCVDIFAGQRQTTILPKVKWGWNASMDKFLFRGKEILRRSLLDLFRSDVGLCHQHCIRQFTTVSLFALYFTTTDYFALGNGARATESPGTGFLQVLWQWRD